MATVPTTYVPGIPPVGTGPLRPYTFLWEHNRHGVPWRAYAFVCDHGYNSNYCVLGGKYHLAVGQRMVDWINSVPAQQRDRTVTRNRLNGGTS